MIEERNALVEEFLHLVPITVAKAVPRIPWCIEYEDLISQGYLALIRAAERFDPTRGVKFSTWAIHLIRRAMLEYLRAEDWVPRAERDKVKRGQAAVILEVVSFDDPLCGAEWANDDPYWETVAERVPDPAPGPEEVVVAAAERNRVWGLVAELPGQEQEAVLGFFWEGLRDIEMGKRWGRSDSRVYQVRARALKRLREWEGLAA